MKTFPEAPAVRMLAGDAAETAEAFRAVIDFKGGTCLLEVRKGFATDGASIPRLFWRAVGHPYQMPLLPCALAHDALYAAELATRDECDAAFLRLMARAGVGRIKRNAVWAAVRAAGWAVWRRHTPESKARARAMCALKPL